MTSAPTETRKVGDAAGSAHDLAVPPDLGVGLGWGGPGRRPGCLLVGVDRSPESLAALEVALDLAGRLGADIEVVHVIDLADYPVDPDNSDWGIDARATIEAEEAAVRAVMATWAGAWSYRAVRGPPATVLATLAEQRAATMIVVGGRRVHHRWDRFVGRPVTHSLLGCSTRPVLVVNGR